MEDQARANELIHQIGSMIVQDSRFTEIPWEGISVVTIVEGTSVQMSTYLYDGAGKPIAKNPGDRELPDKIEELRDAMREPSGREWKAALVQIKRPTMKVTVDFEYDDPLRWKVTPFNLLTKPEELRPK